MRDNEGRPSSGGNGNRPSHLLAPVVLALVLALLVAGYFLFPYAQRVVWHEECIASGRITGC